jgi:uncharacterized membrane protein YadS
MRAWLKTEDAWSLILGLLVVALALANLAGFDLLGFAVLTKVWAEPALGINGVSNLLATFAFLAVLFGTGAWFIGVSPGRFLPAFAVLFFLAYACWFLGHNAYVAATPDKRPPGVSWSLGLTGEAGYLVALLVGLVIGNFVPPLAAWLKDAGRSEWFIKTAIIVYAAALGLKAAGSASTSAILFRGVAAILEAYLIYWALVYLVARRVFGFSREWSAPLASGISICGVSAAITTGAAIRARPVVPVMVSSLVVVFSVTEMLILPALSRWLLPNDPLVAAAWMGLAVKTDGAAFSSGAIVANYFTAGMPDPDGSEATKVREAMILTTTTVKVCIDVFIGVWALVLGAVWAFAIDRRPGRGLPLAEIWERFPKFVLGYFVVFFALFGLVAARPELTKALTAATAKTDAFRQLFFVLTFFSIGMASDFRKLWAEGFGRLALVYVVCLFGFVVWIGLAISWLFFHNVDPLGGTP